MNQSKEMRRLHRKTDEELERIARKLSSLYSRASEELVAKYEKFLERYEAKFEEKKALVEQGKMTKDELYKWQLSQFQQNKHWEEMCRQAALELTNVNANAMKIVNGKIPELYVQNFNRTGVEGCEYVSGITFELVDADTVAFLAKTDKTLLPYKIVDGKRDVRWNTQKVNAEITQGILQGESTKDVAKRLQNVTEMNRASAMRNARTALTSAENKGRFDGQERMKEMGLMVKKEWIATHDELTRDSHASIDGEIVDTDKKFSNDLMHPADPYGDPAEVYNCRCTMGTVVVGYNGKLFDDNRTSYYEEVKLENIGEEELGEINKYFEEFDGKYHARVERVVSTLQKEQEDWDKNVAGTALHFMEQNPKMRKTTAYKRAIEALGERPEKVPIELGGNYTWDSGVMTINTKGLSRNGTLQEDIISRRSSLERRERRMAEGKRIWGFGNVGGTRTSDFIHEYGHAIDATYRISENEKFLKFYRSLSEDQISIGLSTYATTNEREFIAEAFTESFMGDTQGDLSKEFMKILEEIIG